MKLRKEAAKEEPDFLLIGSIGKTDAYGGDPDPEGGRYRPIASNTKFTTSVGTPFLWQAD